MGFSQHTHCGHQCRLHRHDLRRLDGQWKVTHMYTQKAECSSLDRPSNRVPSPPISDTLQGYENKGITKTNVEDYWWFTIHIEYWSRVTLNLSPTALPQSVQENCWHPASDDGGYSPKHALLPVTWMYFITHLGNWTMCHSHTVPQFRQEL